MQRFHTRTVYVPHIDEAEYPLFRDGMPFDVRLPPSYDAWLKKTIRRHAAHRGAGWPTQPVLVTWAEFEAHCLRLRLAPTYALLTSYATYRGVAEQKLLRPPPGDDGS